MSTAVLFVDGASIVSTVRTNVAEDELLLRLELVNALPHVTELYAVAHDDAIGGRGFVMRWRPGLLPDQIQDTLSRL